MRVILKIIVLSFFIFTFNFVAQTERGKWKVGVSGSLVSFSDQYFEIVGEWNYQAPVFEVSRHLSNKLYIDFFLTLPFVEPSKKFNRFQYTSFDTYLRFNLPRLFLGIQTFGGVGLGFVGGVNNTPNTINATSLNFMGGGTLWISDRFGLTGRIIYKHIPESSVSMTPHTQMVAGLVYAFGRL
ncbi:MAG: hypothetical protein ACJA1B_000133 [Polaribacter sp.]|jgi:hypothetical protein